MDRNVKLGNVDQLEHHNEMEISPKIPVCKGNMNVAFCSNQGPINC